MPLVNLSIRYHLVQSFCPQEQFDYLRSLKCNIAQGYFISKAVPADQASELLKSKVMAFKPKDSPRKRHPSVVTDVVAPGRESA